MVMTLTAIGIPINLGNEWIGECLGSGGDDF